MNLARAQSIAEKIKQKLCDLWEHCAIAGSIRRRREWVNDIDLVILPKPGQIEAIQARLRTGCSVVTEGEQNSIYRMPLRGGLEWIQIDVFFARPRAADLLGSTPGNFGSLLVLRTGSKEHNIYLIEHAKRHGLEWKPQAGVFNAGVCVASESEDGIFSALGLGWIAPEKRER